jgi:ketosteroid isomerase-like protein
MSEENVELVRHAVEANRSGPPDVTVEEAVALADPDFEMTSRLTSVEGTTYRGHDGVRRYFEDMADAWQEWRNDIDEMTEVSPDAVLTGVTFRAIGQSGVNVELRSAVVWVLSDGKVVRIHSYPSRQEALEAAGLSE